MKNQLSQQPDIEKMLKNIEISPREAHKNLLRKSLVEKAQTLYLSPSYKFPTSKRSLFSFILKPGLALVGIIGIALFIQNTSTGHNVKTSTTMPAYLEFIEKAKAFNAANKYKLQYTKIHTIAKYLGPHDASMPDESESGMEIWRDDKGNIRYNIKNPGQEDEVSITKKDALGNRLMYLELYELSPEETKGYYESINEQPPAPVSSVHPLKQLNYEREIEKLNNNIVCLNREKGKDFIGESMFSMNSQKREIDEVISHSINIDKRFNTLIDLYKAFAGDLNQEQLLDLIDRYKNSPLIQYEYLQEDRTNYHVFTLESKDFAGISSSSAEGLEYAKRAFAGNYTKYRIYFNAETYGIDKMEDINIRQAQPVENMIMKLEYKYFDEESPALFDTKGFALVQFESVFQLAFEEGTLEFPEGCYQNTQPLSNEETKKYQNLFLQKANPESRKQWQHPLSIDQFYYLPD